MAITANWANRKTVAATMRPWKEFQEIKEIALNRFVLLFISLCVMSLNAIKILKIYRWFHRYYRLCINQWQSLPSLKQRLLFNDRVQKLYFIHIIYLKSSLFIDSYYSMIGFKNYILYLLFILSHLSSSIKLTDVNLIDFLCCNMAPTCLCTHN